MMGLVMPWFVTRLFHVTAGWLASILSLSPADLKSKVLDGLFSVPEFKLYRNLFRLSLPRHP
jgi:hypothetical protein